MTQMKKSNRKGLFFGVFMLVMAVAGCESGTGTANPGTGIGPEGGVVTSGDGKVVLTVPKGALDKNTDIGIQIDSAFAKNFVPVTGFYSFTPDGLKFGSPVTVTFAYDPAKLPKAANEGSIQVFWTDAASAFSGLDSQVDTKAHTINAKITHFSKGAAGLPANGTVVCCKEKDGYVAQDTKCTDNSAPVDDTQCEDVCCHTKDGIKVVARGDCQETDGESLPKVMAMGNCQVVCCKAGKKYESKRKWNCDAASGKAVDKAQCQSVCCASNGDITTRGACWDSGTPETLVMSTDQCAEVCCGNNDDVWDSFVWECNNKSGQVRPAKECADVCCAIGGKYDDMHTRGSCKLAGGTVASPDKCGLVCCQHGDTWEVISNKKCQDNGWKEDAMDDCDKVCCIETDGSLMTQGMCKKKKAEVREAEACDNICCKVGEKYIKSIRGLCEGLGDDLPAEDCEDVCCLDKKTFDYLLKPRGLCKETGAVKEDKDCYQVCCFDGESRDFKFMAAAQCSDPIEDVTECDSVCCAYDTDKYKKTTRGNCRINLKGTPEKDHDKCSSSSASCLDKDGKLMDCRTPPKDNPCLIGPGKCQDKKCVFEYEFTGMKCKDSTDECYDWKCTDKGVCARKLACPAPKNKCMVAACIGGKCDFNQAPDVECSRVTPCGNAQVCNPNTCKCEDVDPPLGGGSSVEGSFSLHDCVGGIEDYDINTIGTLKIRDTMPEVTIIDAKASLGPKCGRGRSSLILLRQRDSDPGTLSHLILDNSTPVGSASEIERVGVCESMGGGGVVDEFTFAGKTHSVKYSVTLGDTVNPGCCWEGNATSTASGSLRIFAQFGVGHYIGTNDFDEVVTRSSVMKMEPLYVPLYKGQCVDMKFRTTGNASFYCSEQGPFSVFYDGRHMGDDVVVSHVIIKSSQLGTDPDGTAWCMQGFCAPKSSTYVIFIGPGVGCFEGPAGTIPDKLFEWSVKVRWVFSRTRQTGL